MKKKSKRTVFAVCINNKGYPASLEAGKLYKVVPDTEAEKHGLIRVVDESGEDYGYSSQRFFVLDVPQALEKVLKGALLRIDTAPKLFPRWAGTEKSPAVIRKVPVERFPGLAEWSRLRPGHSA